MLGSINIHLQYVKKYYFVDIPMFSVIIFLFVKHRQRKEFMPYYCNDCQVQHETEEVCPGVNKATADLPRLPCPCGKIISIQKSIWRDGEVLTCDCGRNFYFNTGELKFEFDGKIIPFLDKKQSVKTQSHYTQFKIQPAVFIAANNLGYFEGNIIKYVCRYNLKNGIEDLKKASHYLEMLIEKVETGEVKL